MTSEVASEFEDPNPETLELIYQTELNAWNELLDDWHYIKNSSQSNIAVSGVMLGLLLNVVQSVSSNPFTVALMSLSTACLIIAALMSVLSQMSITIRTGYQKGDHLYNKYGSRSPAELRSEQLSNLIEVRKELQEKIYSLAHFTNAARAIMVLAILLAGCALLRELC